MSRINRGPVKDGDTIGATDLNDRFDDYTQTTLNAFNNEATPAIGLAYIGGYLRKQGYTPVIVDAVGEGLNEIWYPDGIAGYQCQGLTIEDTVSRIPENTRVIGFSTMFSGEWPVHRALITAVRERFPDAYLVAGGELAEDILLGVGQRPRVAGPPAEGRQLADENHLHPRVEVHEHLDAITDVIDVRVPRREVELEAGDRERGHGMARE